MTTVIEAGDLLPRLQKLLAALRRAEANDRPGILLDAAADEQLMSAIEADLASHRIAALEEAAKGFNRIDELLWVTSGSSNKEALIACLKDIEEVVKPHVRNLTNPSREGEG